MADKKTVSVTVDNGIEHIKYVVSVNRDPEKLFSCDLSVYKNNEPEPYSVHSVVGCLTVNILFYFLTTKENFPQWMFLCLTSETKEGGGLYFEQ